MPYFFILFSIRTFLSAFSYPHFPIRIFPSASAIRRYPVNILQTPKIFLTYLNKNNYATGFSISYSHKIIFKSSLLYPKRHDTIFYIQPPYCQKQTPVFEKQTHIFITQTTIFEKHSYSHNTNSHFRKTHSHF